MDKKELQIYLVDEADYTADEVNEMTDFELVDNYLDWNGIIGYTEDILNVVSAAFGIELDF